MSYGIIYDIVKCPKCLIEHSGAVYQIDEKVFACISCFNKYRRDLGPKIHSMIMQYFQPERLNDLTANSGCDSPNTSYK